MRRALLVVLLAGLMAAPASASPPILAAFFGVDDGLPIQATVLCPPAVLLDGMPVTFREEIDQRTLWPWDFDVITRAGVHHPPLCATTAPANQESEDRTVLLIGQLGESASDPPARVVVTGDLRTESGQSLRGAVAPVIPLSAGPELVYAEPAPAEPENFTYPPLTLPVNGLLIHPTACPAGTVQRVRATWDGGVVAPSGAEAGDAQRTAYTVQMADGRDVTPAAIADLGDMDNNHLLCLDTAGTPVRVVAAAGLFRDPNGDLNPATSVAVSSG